MGKLEDRQTAAGGSSGSVAAQLSTLAGSMPPLDPAIAQGFAGACFCGRISYAVQGVPLFAYLCHCTDCRRINGTAFHTGIVARADDLSLRGQEPGSFACMADSGNSISRFHCNHCGSQLYSQTMAEPAIVSLKAGSVTSAPQDLIRPVLQIFFRSRVPWVPAPVDILTYATGMRGQTPIHPSAEGPAEV
ncbi:MAG: GFA family protein [Pseudomonadota bacterium]